MSKVLTAEDKELIASPMKYKQAVNGAIKLVCGNNVTICGASDTYLIDLRTIMEYGIKCFYQIIIIIIIKKSAKSNRVQL